MNSELSTLHARLGVLDLLSPPVWLFDIENFSMLWANKAAVKLWNAESLADLLSRDFGQVSESTRIRLHSYREGFTQGKTFVERWTFYPKGTPMIVECRCSKSPLPDYPNCMLCEASLVTTSDSERDALRMIEALRHTQVMISLYTMDGKPVLFNPASIKMFGPVGDNAGSLWSHFADPQIASHMQSMLREKQVYSGEFEANTVHGKCWIGVDARVTTDPVTGEDLILLNKIDISSRRSAEEMRGRALLEAENANRARSRFLANVSHELRTPMNGVIGMTSLLLGTPLNMEQRHFIETIQSSGESLLNVINDILDFSKIDAGLLQLCEEPYDPVATVDSVVNIVGGTLGEKQLRLTSVFGPGLPERLLGDASRIKQILLNLVSNAVKFTPSGTVTIRVLLADNAGSRLRIEIQDTGIGISEADQSKLFISFSQVDSRDSRPFSGTGLGLAISRQLVTMMRGDIGVQSRLGEGSLFWFELPLNKVTQGTSEDELASATPATRNNAFAQSLRVLLVEDNVINQRVASIMLRKLGHQVDIIDDGRKAINAANSQRYDIIFMDVQLPEIDGYAATTAIRASGGPNASTPIVALTANAMAGDDKLCLAAGMDGYLSKPVLLPQLAEAIARYVRVA